MFGGGNKPEVKEDWIENPAHKYSAAVPDIADTALFCGHGLHGTKTVQFFLREDL